MIEYVGEHNIIQNFLLSIVSFRDHSALSFHSLSTVPIPPTAARPLLFEVPDHIYIFTGSSIEPQWLTPRLMLIPAQPFAPVELTKGSLFHNDALVSRNLLTKEDMAKECQQCLDEDIPWEVVCFLSPTRRISGPAYKSHTVRNKDIMNPQWLALSDRMQTWRTPHGSVRDKQKAAG